MNKFEIEENFGDLVQEEKSLISLLLDSSLIFQSNRVEYDAKIVICGDTIQLYKFKRRKLIDKDLELLEEDINDKDKNNFFDKDDLFKIENLSRKSEVGYMEYKNVLRSARQVKRLVLANEKIWKTFFTLTFEGVGAKDIDYANKRFNIWRTYMKQLKSDFACIGVPEFQKRGVIHYHLLTNVDYNDFSILSEKERHIWNDKKKTWQIGRDIKGWKYGINMAKDLKGMNVIGYITKYLTKDFDNRLYSRRKYFYTRNIKRPIESNLDLSNLKHYEFLQKILKGKELTFNNSYVDYFGDDVNFMEFTSQHNMYYTKLSLYFL